MRTVRRVAVLGAGTMGSRIAAHFANAGIPALLLDLVLPDAPDRDAAALRGIDAALKRRPSAFFTPEAARLVRPGNLEDDIGGIQTADWVIEAVAENLEIKRAVLERVARWRRPGTIVSTNTSGIPLSRIAEGFSPEFRRNFLGTHFFNPPRYLHLLELIPGPETDPGVVDFLEQFADFRLGKGVVRSNDTPNFIANRIGTFFGATVNKIALEDGYSLEEVEALTGPLIGLPRSASYRLIDIMGVDVWASVAHNVYDLAPEDPWRDRFLPPPFISGMIARGWLGEKTGQGFYRKTAAGEIEVLDWDAFEYRPRREVAFPSVDEARRIASLPDRLRALVASDDRAGAFFWKLFRDVFRYAAAAVPDIAPRIVEIDRAMRWGYAHKLGPFEIWDALGAAPTAARMEELPENVAAMLASGAVAFYRHADENGAPHTEYFDLPTVSYRRIEERPGVLVLADVKRARPAVRRNHGASLVDLGDGVLCLELHGKGHVIGEDQVAMICAALDEAARNYRAMVVASQDGNFSAGANLKLILSAAREGDWQGIDGWLRRFQQTMLAVKYASVPVVVAPFGSTLGAGCELAMHAARVQASAELYMGLVESGVGLVPAGGGSKELLLRLGDPEKTLDIIAAGRVSTSGEDARRLGFLHATDGITMNPERLLGDAKALALSLSPAWSPGLPRMNVRVGGNAAYAALKLNVWLARQAGRVSDYDLQVGEKLAYVLSGGRLTSEQDVSEQYLLDLEREAFLSLCGNAQTQQRIEHMLRTGRPLR